MADATVIPLPLRAGTRVTGETGVAGLIGDPVRHSLLPAICNAAFAAMRCDWVYVAFPAPAGAIEDALTAIRALGVAGVNVTMPHKIAAAAAVDRLSHDAQQLGAVNCVIADDDGELVGHNTDGLGILGALRAEGIPVAGRRYGVVGAGGAGRAIAFALDRAGADVVIVNRTPARAHAAVALLLGDARVGSERDLAELDVIVNATPAGLINDELPFDAGFIRGHHVVVDVNYRVPTPLLRAASARGAHTLHGLGMLIHQAAASISLWTGEAAPIDFMAAAARAALPAERPGSGVVRSMR